jgi:hypothetical protein
MMRGGGGAGGWMGINQDGPSPVELATDPHPPPLLANAAHCRLSTVNVSLALHTAGQHSRRRAGGALRKRSWPPVHLCASRGGGTAPPGRTITRARVSWKAGTTAAPQLQLHGRVQRAQGRGRG